MFDVRIVIWCERQEM